MRGQARLWGEAGRFVGRRFRLRHPAQFVVVAFALVIVAGGLLLMLPFARAAGGGAPPLVALFTSTSAVCVTGLIVVDTPTYWSTYGQLVILLLVQLGGFGIMTFASLLGLLVSRRLGLRSRLTTLAENRSVDLGDVRRVLRGVAMTMLGFESVGAVVLLLRFHLTYAEPWGRAIYLGIYHSVSAFNNAGFALYSDSLMRFTTDPVISLTVAIAVIAGSLGFPVLFELRRELLAPWRWSLHTRLTVWVSLVLLAVGTVAVTVLEWTNPDTLGPLGVPGKLLAGFFQGVMPRSAGFNTVDISELNQSTWLVLDILMFIGGGSAGTGGGIKVTTFALLAFVIVAEARGVPNVVVGNRRVGTGAQRQALSVALVGVGLVMLATLVLLVLADFGLDRDLFEAVSAFGTVGLSTGITPRLPPTGELLVMLLMFIGRLGPITLASALALRSRPVLYRLPEERPIIG